MKPVAVELGELARLLWRGRLTIFILTTIAVVATAAYSLTRRPVFESEAVLVGSSDDPASYGALSGLLGQIGAVGDIFGLGLGGSTNLDETLAVLQSRDFSLRFIQRHDLMPFLFPERWDAEKKRWKAGAQASPMESIREWMDGVANGGAAGDGAAANSVGQARAGGPSFEKALERFQLIRSVSVDRRTGFVRLAVKARSSQLAAKWATMMIEDINGELRARTIRESQLAAKLLSEKLETLKVENLRSTAVAMLEAQLRREVMAQTRSDFALRIIDPPSVPEQRVYPRRTRMVLIGAFLGVLLGSALVLGFPRLQRGR